RARHVPIDGRRPAAEQVRSARARAAERRIRASKRVASRRGRGSAGQPPGRYRGAAVAIGVVVGLVSIPLVVALVQQNDSREAVGVAIAQAEAAAERAIANSHAHAQAHMNDALATAHARGAVVLAPPTPEAPASASADRGTVLVVSGFRAPIDEPTSRELASVIEQLQRHGFETVNNVVGTVSDVDDLRLLVAMRQLHDLSPSLDEAAGAIESWFGRDAAGRYEAAVMLAPDLEAGSAGKDRQRVVIADENSAFTLHSIEPVSIAEYTVRAVKD
ncbi:MAG: hypothetical protein AAGF47_12625, partial [Planctomycetota bacterium]